MKWLRRWWFQIVGWPLVVLNMIDGVDHLFEPAGYFAIAVACLLMVCLFNDLVQHG